MFNEWQRNKNENCFMRQTLPIYEFKENLKICRDLLRVNFLKFMKNGIFMKTLKITTSYPKKSLLSFGRKKWLSLKGSLFIVLLFPVYILKYLKNKAKRNIIGKKELFLKLIMKSLACMRELQKVCGKIELNVNVHFQWILWRPAVFFSGYVY